MSTHVLVPTRPMQVPTGDRPTVCPEGHMQQCLDLLDALRSGAVGDLHTGELLGQGGMGAVYSADEPALARKVALKVPYEDADERMIASMVAEAIISGSLEHPNIVPVHALRVTEDGVPFLVMTKVEGQSWARLLATEPAHGHPATLLRHLRIWLQVCKAAEFAHARGIIHRDIKPENVMVGRHGEVYLLDWGVAATVNPQADRRIPRIDDDNAQAGTPHYMAPEQALGQAADQGPHTDVFLLAATLYEVLSGRPPFDGANALAVMTLASLGRFEPLPERVPHRLAKLASLGLAASPGVRPRSVGAFAAAVERWIDQRAAFALFDDMLARVERLEASAGGEDGLSYGHLEQAFEFVWSQGLQLVELLPGEGEVVSLQRRAAVAMARVALRFDDPHAAHRRLEATGGALGDGALWQAVVSAKTRFDALRKESMRRDPTRERRRRGVALLIVGSLWVGTPLAAALGGEMPALRQIQAGNVLAGLVVLAVLLVWRNRLWVTLQNRLTVSMMLGGSWALAALDTVGIAAGTPPRWIYVQHLAVTALAVGAAAAAVDAGLWVALVGYLAAFGIALADPGHVMAWIAAANLVLCLNVGALWLRSEG